jgi:N-acetylmuramoyl-L-alanine amidase
MAFTVEYGYSLRQFIDGFNWIQTEFKLITLIFHDSTLYLNLILKGGPILVLNKILSIGISLLMVVSFGVLPVNAAVMHNIQNGDSLYKIAVNNETSVKELKQINGLTGDRIFPGNQLVVPEKSKTSQAAVSKKGDVDLLARLVTAEAGAEPFKGKVAVASVILNRSEDKNFPETISGNIFKPHEFESVSNGLIWNVPTKDSYKAAEVALKGWDPTYGAKYFFNPAKLKGPSWVQSRRIVERIGNHVFGV